MCMFSSGFVFGAEVDLSGKWYYTEMLYADGKGDVLRNRESLLEFSGNKYTQALWVGTTMTGRDGTYTVNGNQLTLKESGGEKEVYTMTYDPDKKSLTLRSADGSGWKLERLK